MSTSTAVALQPEQTRSILRTMSARYGMEAAAFEQTLRATVVPDKCTREQFAAFLVVANEYGLNPLTKEIYAFPARTGGIQPIVSIDGWVHIINAQPAMDGLAFDDHMTADGKLTAITAIISRKDREKPISVTEYMAECWRDTDTWKKWPRRMLRHKALIQCARYAFGFSGIVDQDEYERSVPLAPSAPEPKQLEPMPERRGVGRPRKVREPEHDPETGEVSPDTGWPEPDAPPPDDPEAPDLSDPDVVAGFNDAQAGRKTCLDPAIRRSEARFARWRAGYYYASGENVTS